MPIGLGNLADPDRHRIELQQGNNKEVTTMTVSEMPSAASRIVLTYTKEVKHLLSLCDLKAKVPGAASCVHYQNGYLFTTDGHRTMFFRVDHTHRGNSPLEQCAIYGTEIASLIKQCKTERLDLDLGSFTNRTACLVNGMALLKGYVPTSISSIDAVRIRGMMQADEIFGLNVVWQFIGQHLLLSTGSNTFYTIAAKYGLELDYFGTTPIVAFRRAFFEGIPSWSKMSIPNDRNPQIFSMPDDRDFDELELNDRMYYLVMPVELRGRPTVDIAFENAVEYEAE